MQLQHVNVKLLLQNAEGARLEPLIPVFHSWIEHQNGDELLIDIADYTHVPAGPGVVLIGHEGNYSVDNTGNRLGVRYNRKAAVDEFLSSPLAAGSTITMIFNFAQAGAVTMGVPVEPQAYEYATYSPPPALPTAKPTTPASGSASASASPTTTP